MIRLRWAVWILIAAPNMPAAATDTDLASTDVGTVTTQDLEFELTHPPGSLPEGDLSPRDWPHLENLLRVAAYHQILSHLGEAEGISNTPAHQAWLQQLQENALAQHAQRALIDSQVRVTPDEVRAYVEENRELTRLPAVAVWRFMHFEVSREASDSLREQALARAHEARAAVDAGEDFAAVAARLASPPASGAPGRPVGPLEFEGRTLPVIEDALRSLPIDTVSEPLDTPAGPVLLQVVSRELERYPEEGNIIFQLGSRLRAERMAARRQQVLAELASRHPVELAQNVSPSQASGTVVLRVGQRVLTLEDLRRRALGATEPGQGLTSMLTPGGLAELAERQLFVAEMEETGVAASPDLLAQAEANQRVLEWERIERELEDRRRPAPPPEQIREQFENHREEFARDLLTVEALWIGHATLARLTSSDYGLDHLHQAQSLRDRWAQGEPLDRLTAEIVSGDESNSGSERWERVLAEELPSHVADLLGQLVPGDYSPVYIGPSGALILHWVDVTHDTPRLDQVTRDVVRSIYQSQPPLPDLRDALLDQFHYRQVTDFSRLRWSADGRLVLGPVSEEAVTADSP